MSAGSVLPPLSLPHSLIHQPSSYLPLKRKFGPASAPSGVKDLCYPSPPMSGPPSPPPTAPSLSHSAGNDPTTLIVTTTAAGSISDPSKSAPALAIPADSPQQHSTTIHGPQPRGTVNTSQPLTESVSPYDPHRHAPPAFSVYPTFSTQPSGRSGSKTKAHVASACVNCKRAHLSCDVQRPCARCVSSGKQANCYDVQHKKRGRPRLRDEGDFKVGKIITEQPAPIAVQETTVASGSRPIATPRQRRAGSIRSSSSQNTEGSTVQTFTIPPPLSLQPQQSYQQPPPGGGFAPADIPTAFLNVDLVILRANRAFAQIMSANREVTGRSMSSVALPADGQSFETIRARLAAEVDRREGTSLPPISPPGEDPLQGVTEADADRLTSSFEDRMYTWTRNSAGQSSQTFPARVRLAKSSTYFVVVTLPSFQPVVPAAATASKMPTPYSAAPQQFYGPTQSGQHSATSVRDPLPPTSRLTPSSGAAQYPPSQWSATPYQRAATPAAPRLPTIEPPTYTTTYPSRASTAAEILPPQDPGAIQLPPLAGSAGRSSRASSFSTEAQARRTSASEEDEEDRAAPKKRKIMGIDNVLQ